MFHTCELFSSYVHVRAQVQAVKCNWLPCARGRHQLSSAICIPHLRERIQESDICGSHHKNTQITCGRSTGYFYLHTVVQELQLTVGTNKNSISQKVSKQADWRNTSIYFDGSGDSARTQLLVTCVSSCNSVSRRFRNQVYGTRT